MAASTALAVGGGTAAAGGAVAVEEVVGTEVGLAEGLAHWISMQQKWPSK